jgi:hypothetical protein
VALGAAVTALVTTVEVADPGAAEVDGHEMRAEIVAEIVILNLGDLEILPMIVAANANVNANEIGSGEKGVETEAETEAETEVEMASEAAGTLLAEDALHQEIFVSEIRLSGLMQKDPGGPLQEKPVRRLLAALHPTLPMPSPHFHPEAVTLAGARKELEELGTGMAEWDDHSMTNVTGSVAVVALRKGDGAAALGTIEEIEGTDIWTVSLAAIPAMIGILVIATLLGPGWTAARYLMSLHQLRKTCRRLLLRLPHPPLVQYLVEIRA